MCIFSAAETIFLLFQIAKNTKAVCIADTAWHVQKYLQNNLHVQPEDITDKLTATCQSKTNQYSATFFIWFCQIQKMKSPHLNLSPQLVRAMPLFPKVSCFINITYLRQTKQYWPDQLSVCALRWLYEQNEYNKFHYSKS